MVSHSSFFSLVFSGRDPRAVLLELPLLYSPSPGYLQRVDVVPTTLAGLCILSLNLPPCEFFAHINLILYFHSLHSEILSSVLIPDLYLLYAWNKCLPSLVSVLPSSPCCGDISYGKFLLQQSFETCIYIL